LSRSATAEEIKAAFKKLAAQHHPDRNPDDPDSAHRFKEVNTAYQVLSDQNRRAMYDRFGHRAESSGSPFGAGGPFAGGVVDFSELNLDGVLGDILGVFGVGKGDKGDLRRTLEVTFEEAAFGCTKDVRYDRVITCHSCDGSGGAPGSPLETCDQCGGRGRVRLQQGLLPIAVERTCNKCRGRGRLVTNPCAECRGGGLVTESKTVNVTLPPGVAAGDVRLVNGGGNRPRPDKPAGDLELEVAVLPHPFFKRDGDDVTCGVPITFAQAALGAEIDVPMIDGRGKMRVPPGTQPGTTLRVRGKGIPKRSGMGRGDAHVTVQVEVPSQLTAKQRELVEQLGRELGEDVQPLRRTFAEKLRGLFE
jgi:molecular chaperone DnaJ